MTTPHDPPQHDDDQDLELEAELAEEPSPEGRLENDRPSAAGYPPDSGPEQRVMFVRPVFFRASPLRTLGLLILPILAAVFAHWLVDEDTKTRAALWTLLVAGVLAYGTLLVWWLLVTKGRALELTNKRIIERRGLLSRSSDEVLHDHIRNIQVDQSFYQRIVKVGKLGVASSGQDRTEIQMDNLPDPDGIREVIDLYRPL